MTPVSITVFVASKATPNEWWADRNAVLSTVASATAVSCFMSGDFSLREISRTESVIFRRRSELIPGFHFTARSNPWPVPCSQGDWRRHGYTHFVSRPIAPASVHRRSVSVRLSPRYDQTPRGRRLLGYRPALAVRRADHARGGR